MKTRERILQTSLLLFNEEGESSVTTVDIANELDISPGNLYYHFRGKEVIVDELYLRFDVAMTEILRAPIQKPLELEDNWFYLYVVFQEIYEYRFLYHNLTDIMRRYESIRKKFKRLLGLKAQATGSIVSALSTRSVLNISERERHFLTQQMAMTITYWLEFADLLEAPQRNSVAILHQGVFQVMTLIAPYLAEGHAEFYTQCSDFYDNAVKQSSTSA